MSTTYLVVMVSTLVLEGSKTDPDGKIRKWLKGPSDPKRVKKHGYSFTDKEEEAWPFPNEKQAMAKAKVLDRHFSAPYATKHSTFEVHTKVEPVTA